MSMAESPEWIPLQWDWTKNATQSALEYLDIGKKKGGKRSHHMQLFILRAKWMKASKGWLFHVLSVERCLMSTRSHPGNSVFFRAQLFVKSLINSHLPHQAPQLLWGPHTPSHHVQWINQDSKQQKPHFFWVRSVCTDTPYEWNHFQFTALSNLVTEGQNTRLLGTMS